MTDLQSLGDVLAKRYGITVDKVVSLKSVMGIVAADQTRWIWKYACAKDTELRLQALHSLVTELEGAGLTCAGPIPTQDERFLVRLPSAEQGYLQPWLDGRHVDFSKRSERLETVSRLALMHRYTAPYRDHFASVLTTGNLHERLNRKRIAMAKAWPVAKEQLPQLIALEDLLWNGMERALAQLAAWPGSLPLTFCHRDLAPHNVLYRKGQPQSIALIDFDQAGYDQPYLDILQMCNHALYFSDVGEGYFQEMLGAYTSRWPLPVEEELRIWELLSFPDLLIRSTIEWVANGCPQQGQAKVLASAAKERLRWRLLRVGAPWSGVS